MGLNATFYQGDAERLPEIVPPQHFDLVYSFGVIHHTPRPEQVIAHIREHYMGPGSELRLMLYSKWCWKTFWIVASYGKGAFWRAPQLIATHSEAQTGCPVTFTYSFNELRLGLLKDFRVTSLAKDHVFPYVIEKYVKYEYERMWYFRWMPPGLFRWFERRAGWHTLITGDAAAVALIAPPPGPHARRRADRHARLRGRPRLHAGGVPVPRRAGAADRAPHRSSRSAPAPASARW